MIGVEFFAEDKSTKHRTSSTKVFFIQLDETVESLIALNRDKILKVMPNSRVIAVITEEGE
jgi:hypothetical protein